MELKKGDKIIAIRDAKYLYKGEISSPAYSKGHEIEVEDYDSAKGLIQTKGDTTIWHFASDWKLVEEKTLSDKISEHKLRDPYIFVEDVKECFKKLKDQFGTNNDICFNAGIIQLEIDKLAGDKLI